MSGRGALAEQTHRAGRRTRTTLRLLAALLLALGLAGVGVPPARAADNVLVASEPGDREELDRPPGFVTLAFEDPVDPSLAKLLVQDAGGTNVTVGGLVVEGTNLASQLADPLPEGTYTVTYRVARGDGQPQGGTFQFSYGPGTFAAPASTWSGVDEEPAVLKNPDPNAVTPDPRSAEPSPSGSGSSPGVPPGPGPGPGEPSTSPSASRPASTSPGAAGPPTPTAGPTGDGADRPGLVVGALVLLGVAAAGTGLALQRRRTRSTGRP